MHTSRATRRILAAVSGAALFAGGMATSASLGAGADPRRAHAVPGFGQVVSLSHVNDPAATPIFPGDPRFRIRTVFTVPEDGYYLEVVREGAHTGTHYSAPCHFHDGALCMDELDASDLVLPAVVIDVREETAADPDHEVGIDDLQAWEAEFGEMPEGAAVLLLTGCSAFWGAGPADDETYENCGSGLAGGHQPGFTRNAVRWLIQTGVLGRTGALGTDTFGPDPASDAAFMPTWLTLRRHRLTIENLTNLDALPPVGAWIAVGSPLNVHGSGAPGNVLAFVP